MVCHYRTRRNVNVGILNSRDTFSGRVETVILDAVDRREALVTRHLPREFLKSTPATTTPGCAPANGIRRPLIELRQAGPYRLGHVLLTLDLLEEVPVVGHGERVELDRLEKRR